jgi:hypothetical protein
MKVKELMALLAQHNPEMEVLVPLEKHIYYNSPTEVRAGIAWENPSSDGLKPWERADESWVHDHIVSQIKAVFIA